MESSLSEIKLSSSAAKRFILAAYLSNFSVVLLFALAFSYPCQSCTHTAHPPTLILAQDGETTQMLFKFRPRSALLALRL
jgi:hypothetical protein